MTNLGYFCWFQVTDWSTLISLMNIMLKWLFILILIWCDDAGAAFALIKEMDSWFLLQNVMQAMGILYPQYWLQGDCEESFSKHIRVLMDYYGHGKILGKDNNKVLVLALIDRELLLSH